VLLARGSPDVSSSRCFPSLKTNTIIYLRSPTAPNGRSTVGMYSFFGMSQNGPVLGARATGTRLDNAATSRRLSFQAGSAWLKTLAVAQAELHAACCLGPCSRGKLLLDRSMKQTFELAHSSNEMTEKGIPLQIVRNPKWSSDGSHVWDRNQVHSRLSVPRKRTLFCLTAKSSTTVSPRSTTPTTPPVFPFRSPLPAQQRPLQRESSPFSPRSPCYLPPNLSTLRNAQPHRASPTRPRRSPQGPPRSHAPGKPGKAVKSSTARALEAPGKELQVMRWDVEWKDSPSESGPHGNGCSLFCPSCGQQWARVRGPVEGGGPRATRAVNAALDSALSSREASSVRPAFLWKASARSSEGQPQWLDRVLLSPLRH